MKSACAPLTPLMVTCRWIACDVEVTPMVTPTVTPTVTLWTPMVDNAVEVPLPQARGQMPRQGMPCRTFQSLVGLVITPHGA